MDILSVIAAVLRRWYVTVPIGLLALAAAYYVHTTLPPQYQAQGQILLASPDLDPQGLPRTVVNLGEVAGEAATAEVQNELVDGAADLRITARVGSLTLDITGPTADVVERTYTNALSWLDDAIRQRQEDADIDPAEQLILQQDSDLEVVERDGGGFELSGRLGLVDPTAGVPNPFGANNPTARILIVAIQSDAGQLRVAERTGPGVGFSVSQDTRDAAAIIQISTMGPDPGNVLEAYDHVADVLEAELQAREERAEVPETRRTRIERIAEPQRVTDTSPPLDRTVAAIIGLGGALALISAVVLESIASRRRDHTDGQRPSPPHASQQPGVTPSASAEPVDEGDDEPDVGERSDSDEDPASANLDKATDFFASGTTGPPKEYSR